MIILLYIIINNLTYVKIIITIYDYLFIVKLCLLKMLTNVIRQHKNNILNYQKIFNFIIILLKKKLKKKQLIGIY